MNREELETAEEIAETEAEASIIGDVAAAEIIAGEEPAAEDTGAPIVIEAPAEEIPEEPAAEEPPEAEHTAPATTSKRGGYWGSYR